MTQSKIDWLVDHDIRPYVYMRKENRPGRPGVYHDFHFAKEILFFEPTEIASTAFGRKILDLENAAFSKLGIGMAPWIFYDCAIMPGLSAGFAIKTSKVPESMQKVLALNNDLEWTPISLFIAIPSLEDNHWVANNLCSIGSLLPKTERMPHLGYLTKAFALWYANIEYIYGVTQWKNPAVKLHTNFGFFELITAYTPIHDYPNTLTYKVKVDSRFWKRYLGMADEQISGLAPTSHAVVADEDETQIRLQEKIENNEGPFYLNGWEIMEKGFTKKFPVFRME